VDRGVIVMVNTHEKPCHLVATPDIKEATGLVDGFTRFGVVAEG